MQRALVDFGAEESFGQAAKRFQEHYGWSIDRAAVRREVEHTATKAEQYVETRLWDAGWDYIQPLTIRPAMEQVLVELDGSHVRTGKFVVLEGTELTKKRRLRKSQRPTDWREVRVGFARPLGAQKDERTFVAQMSHYPELAWRLERAAFMQGMSTRTEIIAVADGGNGLRESLEKQFPRLTFILDRPDLKQHLYAGAEAIGLTGCERHDWVDDKLRLIDRGKVQQVIRTLKGYRGKAQERITNLSQYLERFSNAVYYNRFRALGLPIGSGEVAHCSPIYSSKALENSRSYLASRNCKSDASAANYSS